MKLLLTTALLAAFLALAAATAPANVAQDDAVQAKATQRTTPAAAPPPAPTKLSDPEAYEKEVQAATEQRDKDLAEAAKIPDRATFEKRRGEIMAQHLAIMAKLREKYLESVDEGKVQPPPPPPPKQPVAKAKTKRSGGFLTSLLSGIGKSSKAGAQSKTRGDDSTGTELSEAQKKLDDENQRHKDQLDELNRQMKAAQASGNTREVRKVQRAIDKENTTYAEKKAKLERAVQDAGGQLDTPADTSKNGSKTSSKTKSHR